jgi:hypothetical protein
MIIIHNFLFLDVVAAYKNLKKEKEALESTVRVFSSATAPTASSGETTTSENETNLNAKEVILFIYFEKFTNL